MVKCLIVFCFLSFYQNNLPVPRKMPDIPKSVTFKKDDTKKMDFGDFSIILTVFGGVINGVLVFSGAKHIVKKLEQVSTQVTSLNMRMYRLELKNGIDDFKEKEN